MYQSVFNKLRLTIRTSVRYPSTSCTYHNGNVSLSPLVKRIAFGSQLAIPADKIGYLTRYSLSAQNEQSSSSIHFTAQIRTREFGKVFRVREIVSFGTSHDTERVLQFPTKLQPKTDIIFNVVNSDGNNGSVNADFDVALHDL